MTIYCLPFPKKSCFNLQLVLYTRPNPGFKKFKYDGGHLLIAAGDTKPKSLKSDQLVVEELGAELMIYDQTRNQAFCLNQKAAFVWKRCDGNTTVADIASQMAKSLGEPIDEKIVEFALQNLSKDGLLEAHTFMPFVSTGMNRRELMRTIGVRAAIALPIVTALAVATPKAHASSYTPPPPA